MHDGAAVRNRQADVGWNENAHAFLISAQDLALGELEGPFFLCDGAVKTERKVFDETGVRSGNC